MSFDGVAEEAETVEFDGIILVELRLVVWNDFVGFKEAKMILLDLLQTQKLKFAPNPETI